MGLQSSFYSGVLFLMIVSSCRGLTPTQIYTQREDLAPQRNRFVLFWKSDNRDITFEVHARTQGWLGLGITKIGGMVETDIALGWIKDDGTAVLQDRYSRKPGTPVLDERQNMTLISGRRTNDYIILVFKRPLVACDTADVSIERMNMKLVWAVGKDIPGEHGDPAKHGYDDKGSKTVLLLSAPKTQQHGLPPEAESINLMFSNMKVEPLLGDYKKVYKKIPDIGRKRHLIMWEPLVQPGNEDIVHHLVVYLAYNTSADAPDYWQGSGDLKYRRTVDLLAWSVGGGKVWLPDDIGMSLGGPEEEASGQAYLALEVNYHNTQLMTGRRDSSGIRLWVTERLRPKEAGLIMTGAGWSDTNFVIPPKSPNFVVHGYCAKECIQEGFAGQSEVTIFMVMLHGHAVGSTFNVRHVRDGVELPPITAEKYHDTEFQEFRVLLKPITLRATDELIVECGFDTSKKRDLTVGAATLEDEMCLAIFLYYPHVPFRYCLSNPSDNQLLKFLNLKVIGNKVSTQGPYFGKTALEVLRAQDWSKSNIRNSFQENTREGDFEIYCRREGLNTTLPSDGKPLKAKLPRITYNYGANPDDCPYKTLPSGSIHLTAHVITLEILVVMAFCMLTAML